MTLELGSIEGITLTRCAGSPFLFPLNVGLELGQFHQKKPFQNNIGREKDMYQSGVTYVPDCSSKSLNCILKQGKVAKCFESQC